MVIQHTFGLPILDEGDIAQFVRDTRARVLRGKFTHAPRFASHCLVSIWTAQAGLGFDFKFFKRVFKTGHYAES